MATEDAVALKNKGNEAFKAKDWPAAIEWYDKAIQANDKEPSFYTNRAQAHIKMEAYGFAIADATKAIELNPDFVKAYYDDVPEHTFDDVINVNSVGPYWLTFAFLPLLEKWKEHGYGNGARKFAPQIIMTSSMNGWTKDPATSGFSFPYLFSKAAIGQATSTLAHELLPLGIRVNGIAPGKSKRHSRERDTDTAYAGLFVTEMSKPGLMDEIGFSHSDKHSHNFVIPSQQLPPSLGGPTNVGGSHRDMGSLALFLVANFFVNGETVLIDGGVSPH